MKLTRVFAGEIGVESLDRKHVGVDVAGGQEHRPQAADLLFVIHIGQHNRHLGTDGDMVKTYTLDEIRERVK